MLGSDVTSRASRPSAAIAASSASCRARRRSAPTAGRQVRDQALEAQPVTVRAEARHHAHREIRAQRPATLRLARDDVREMHLDERHAAHHPRVAYREAAVRDRGGGAPDAAEASGPPRFPGVAKNWSKEKPPVAGAAVCG